MKDEKLDEKRGQGDRILPTSLVGKNVEFSVQKKRKDYCRVIFSLLTYSILL